MDGCSEERDKLDDFKNGISSYTLNDDGPHNKTINFHHDLVFCCPFIRGINRDPVS